VTEEKDGPVHYQVSVTGRQAATFFLGLLAALGLSFFFGMKTGAAAKRGMDPISALTAQSDIAVPAAEPERRGDRATPAPTEAPIGFEAAAPEPPATKPPATKAPKASVPEPRAPKVEEPKIVELAPEPTAVPTRKPSATAVPVKEPAAAKQGDETFWVQVLVTGSAEKADGLSKKLKADGFKPDVSLVPGKKELFRVRVGPYSDRAKAEAGSKKVEKLEKLETTIVAPGK